MYSTITRSRTRAIDGGRKPMTTQPLAMPARSSMTVQEAAEHAALFRAQLSAQFLERESEIRGLMLAAVAGHSVLLLGPPGTAKSALTNAFTKALGWSTFTRLITRMTQPEELFGPFSLLGLEQDIFERKTNGYLPTSEAAFLDEVFKGSSTILNGLLTLLNERRFDNGTRRDEAPLRLCVGASNELPQEEGLEAILDRFLIRFWVSPLLDDDHFTAMLTASSAPDLRLDPSVVEVLAAAARTVDVRPVVGAVLRIRAALKAERINASDRRWRQAMSLVQASAVLAGRTTVHSRDLSVLSDCLWDRAEDRAVIHKIVAKLRNPGLAEVEELREEARKKAATVPANPSNDDLAAAMTTLKELKVATEKAEAKARETGDAEVLEVAQEIARFAREAKVRALGATAGLRDI
jgi:MoxR-like ATPase